MLLLFGLFHIHYDVQLESGINQQIVCDLPTQTPFPNYTELSRAISKVTIVHPYGPGGDIFSLPSTKGHAIQEMEEKFLQTSRTFGSIELAPLV
jgi:hypothetical protein